MIPQGLLRTHGAMERVLKELIKSRVAREKADEEKKSPGARRGEVGGGQGPVRQWPSRERRKEPEAYDFKGELKGGAPGGPSLHV